MKKILILHRADLFNLTSDLPMDMIAVDHFKIPFKEYNDAEFIAFEEFGLLKILKNTRGHCVTIPWASFLMAIEMITKQEALRKDFPKDMAELYEPGNEYFRLDRPSSFELPQKPNTDIVQEYWDKALKPDPGKGASLAMGYDPAHKEQQDPRIGVYMKDLSDPNGPFKKIAAPAWWGDDRVLATLWAENGRIELALSEPNFSEEVKKMSKYYGNQLLPDYDDEINSSVATAIEKRDIPISDFPVTLWEAILYFNPMFIFLDNKLTDKREVYFVSCIHIHHPQLYAEFKKQCGFWCEDTELFKNLGQYGCKHEDCMLGVILKGIYRFRKYIN